ncbi:hypothetical protein FQN57_006995 [Myotisia sp. PD_48]|nr:hypothetical protein FQN57_006995 [Myotisia sp. PD_48]
MAKSKRGKGGAAADGGKKAPRRRELVVEERHDPFQAVVLTDVFEKRFEPFTLEKPRCLLPIANTLLIDYTLEFLANAGVEDIILYTGDHADQFETYINGSKWKSIISPFTKIRVIRTTATSYGDIMRDLHEKHLMHGDFLLVNGDIVGNMPLDDALAEHQARRQDNRNAIMTMILREVGESNRVRKSAPQPVFVIDPAKQRCLHYQELKPQTQDGQLPSLEIDPEIIENHSEVDIRNDLYDCRIDICTPEVLGLWADSFDYQTPRSHFLYGVLKDYELNGMTIHTHIMKDFYATRVQNLLAYDIVNRDVISRWTFPLCPDINLFPGCSYSLKRNMVYQEQNVILGRSAVVHSRSVIGKDTIIGESSSITNSVIGRRCKIGKNVVLDGAYIWDDVIVGDATEIRQAIIANGVIIGDKCRIEPGALLSYGVKIANDISIPESMRITRLQRGSEPTPNEVKLVGEGGEGFEFISEEDEDDDERLDLVPGLIYNMAELSLSNASISTFSSEDSEEIGLRSRSGSLSTFASDTAESDQFHPDAVSSVLDGLKEGLSAEVIQLELVGLRMSANASEHQVRRAVVVAFMKYIQHIMEGGTTAIASAVRSLFSKYKDIITRIIFDQTTDQKPDQVDLLLLFQQDLTERTKGENVLLFTAKELYDLDIIDEEAIHQWWGHERSTSTEAMRNVRLLTQPFVEWLENAESDESDEDEDEISARSHRSSPHLTHLNNPQRLDPPGSKTTPPTSATTSQKPRKRKAAEVLDGDHIFPGDTKRISPDLGIHQPSASSDVCPKLVPASGPAVTAFSTSTTHTKHSSISEATEGTTSMDSDDEFMSDASSQGEFLDTQDSDNESLGDEFDEDLGGSFTYEKDIKPSRPPYEVECKPLSPADIQYEQNLQINEVSSILGLPLESSAILLRFARWNREKLIESYMDHPDRTLEEAGLGPTSCTTPKTETVSNFMCEICCEDDADLQTYAMCCGHRFCVDCYRYYLAQKIREEGEAARIECPQEKCHRIVDYKTLDLLVTKDLKERYRLLLLRTYVDDIPNLKWCPAPNCEYAVRCGIKERDLGRIVPTVRCACSFLLCFGCSLADHQPCPCPLVKKWLKKCKDDSETANWISANTKECPKCHSTIEKNGGCNHMTCRKCKHEFCWMCMGLWSEHGTSWYNCNRYEEKSGSEARDSQTRSRKSLERYLHYYNRYANHEQSAKLDQDLYLRTERMMVNLQSQSGLSWIEVQFLDTASKALQECRRTLKWTYAFAFYLARNNLTEIFEDNQKDLEMAVESLSEMFEKPISDLAGLKVDILDKTAYCNKRRVILLSDTAENLKAGEWEFNVDVQP